MGAARDAEQEREQDEAGMAGAPGAVSGEEGAAVAQPPPPVLVRSLSPLPPQSPWNLMIKHRLVQRRGRRSQVMSR